MNVQELLSQLRDLVRYVVWPSIREFGKGHTLLLLGSAVAVLVAVTSWSFYCEYMTKEIVFVTGPRGGVSLVRAKEKIAPEMEERSRRFGARYVVRVEETDGFEENRKRVSSDTGGNLIGFAYDGFAYDGFGESDNVNILLPLERHFLHILCRKEFLEEHKPRGREDSEAPESGKTPGNLASAPTRRGPQPLYWAVGNQPLFPGERHPSGEDNTFGPKRQKITFSKIGETVKKHSAGRVFLGPPDSGTRQVAICVMSHFQLDPGKYQTHGIANFDEMRAALNAGAIDVAFYNGPLNAKIIRDIVKDGTCVLVGLDGDRDAIEQAHFGLHRGEFKANSYQHGEFCPTKIETLVTRNVLICSRAMPKKDAYFLGMASYRALRDAIPEIDWTNAPPNDPKIERLNYPLHPAAELIRKGERPSQWPQNLQYLWLTIGLWLALEAIRAVNKRFQPVQSEGSPGRSAAKEGSTAAGEASRSAANWEISTNSYEMLNNELEQKNRELELAPFPLTQAAYNKWSRTISDLRRRALSEHQAGRLDASQARGLLERIGRELEWEQALRKPQQRPANRRSSTRRNAP